MSLLLVTGLVAAVITGCSGGDQGSGVSDTGVGAVGEVDPNAPEALTPGDIPDDQVFVPFTPTGQPLTLSVPEGWGRTGNGSTATTFTDKLNAITIVVTQAPSAPTVETVMSDDVPSIAAAATGYQAGDTDEVTRKGGVAILSTYRADAEPDPVTGKVLNDDVERYVFWRAGTEVVLTLAGPHGADNVDPWKLVTDSFTWSS